MIPTFPHPTVILDGAPAEGAPRSAEDHGCPSALWPWMLSWPKRWVICSPNTASPGLRRRIIV